MSTVHSQQMKTLIDLVAELHDEVQVIRPNTQTQPDSQSANITKLLNEVKVLMEDGKEYKEKINKLEGAVSALEAQNGRLVEECKTAAREAGNTIHESLFPST